NGRWPRPPPGEPAVTPPRRRRPRNSTAAAGSTRCVMATGRSRVSRLISEPRPANGPRKAPKQANISLAVSRINRLSTEDEPSPRRPPVVAAAPSPSAEAGAGGGAGGDRPGDRPVGWHRDRRRGQWPAGHGQSRATGDLTRRSAARRAGGRR